MRFRVALYAGGDSIHGAYHSLGHSLLWDFRGEVWGSGIDFSRMHPIRAGRRKAAPLAATDSRVVAVVDTVAWDTLWLDFREEIERL